MTQAPTNLNDDTPAVNDQVQEILASINDPDVRLSPGLFYDEYGSSLFAQVCASDEYYLFRAEKSILDKYVGEMAEAIGENALLVEYGSGNSEKTRTLLRNIPNLAGYVPIDVSRDFLYKSAEYLSATFPELEILPLCTDYNSDFALPTPKMPVEKTVAYYAGSTVGAVVPEETVEFLTRVRNVCSPQGGLLVGMDLKKDIDLLLRAYSMTDLVTNFHRNVLEIINRKYGSNFNKEWFQPVSIYNEEKGRVDLTLISRRNQKVRLGGQDVSFTAGQHWVVSFPHKYTLDEFAQLVGKAGWTVRHAWVDDDQLFSIHYLE